ncbi:hypothetical protein WA158_003724 [Blastocystis sp. Blastoise]
MAKNKGKGGKNRRRGKNDGEAVKRELEFKEDGQEYGKISKMLGNGRVEVYCFDDKTRLCKIRGKMRKKEWVGIGDIVLIGLRDYQDDKADVILRYNADEARQLKALGELPENANIEYGAANVNLDGLDGLEIEIDGDDSDDDSAADVLDIDNI